VILEWPDAQAARDFVNDPDYAPYLEARHKGSTSVHFIIDGKDELA